MTRAQVHERYGGNRQGAISPSDVTNSIHLFTDLRSALVRPGRRATSAEPSRCNRNCLTL